MSGWIGTPTGAVVWLIWFSLLVASFVFVKMTPLLLLIELAGMMFGLYASSLAFRKDRVAGYVVTIAMVFSYVLLNSALYMTTVWTNPLAR